MMRLSRRRSARRLTLEAAAICCGVAATAQAEFGIVSNPSATDVVPQVVSGTNASLTNAINISAAVGAYRFYNEGVLGQATTSWVVDGGFAWGSHESLSNLWYASSSPDATSDFDGHATACAMLVGGRPASPYTAPDGSSYYSVINTGIAWGTTLGSSALATSFNQDGSFNTSAASVSTAFSSAFGMADVVSTSIGLTPDPAGLSTMSGLVDALARSSRHTTVVAAAGNSGRAATAAGRMLGGPASGYNAISVGASGSSGNPSSYTTVAPFSSRGPQTTAWYDGSTVFVAASGSATRAGIDIVAPGTALVSAAYVSNTGPTDSYYLGLEGTSFSTPMVAGGAALLVSGARTLASLADSVAAATQSVVVKSVLLNSADKLSGWNNGQSTVDGVVTTTQALDWSMGAGSMNLSRAFDQFTVGTRDVSGTASGQTVQVSSVGWDYGGLVRGGTNAYTIAGVRDAGQTLTVTLDWLRERTWDASLLGGEGDYRDIAQADLDLSVWDMTGDGMLVAESRSLVNTVEHLAFTIPSTSTYQIRVGYRDNLFDLTSGQTYSNQDYGVSWSVTGPTTIVIPEPSAVALAVIGSLVMLAVRPRVRRA